ncbi:MAG: class I SAM-dependent methyltransferase [bacterium]
MSPLFCRACGEALQLTFLDLGKMPLSNAFLSPERSEEPEIFYPLHARVCEHCWLVQVPAVIPPEGIFSDYPYFSSFSTSWLHHAKTFAEHAIQAFGLNERSLVLEVACNDGYLLRHFKDRKVGVLGVEPAANVAKNAEALGIPVVKEFFGSALARRLCAEKKAADLVVANNVLAHVPDLNDFVSGLREVLGSQGMLSLEFPHLLRLIQGNQFDTIYHEHYSYFSFLSVEQVLRRHGLKVVEAEEIPTHGGSLRLSVRHENFAGKEGEGVARLRQLEARAGLGEIEIYRKFGERARRAKRNILSLLIRLKEEGKTIAAYGAPAKGTILLHYCGIQDGFLDYAVDRNPAKQGCYFPGTKLPIYPPERISQSRPDVVLILPWNLEAEIRGQLAEIREWGGQFLVPIPEPHLVCPGP